MSEEERYEVLVSLPFMERCPEGDIYRVTGTPYVYFMWDRVWAWSDPSDWRIVSFEEVFHSVDNDIRGEMVFHLDLFR
jgi:hypothetical protein